MLIDDVAAQAAARLNLTRGRDNIWRGRCPVCGYAKQSLELAVQRDRIVVRCTVCGADASIARMMGLPSELVVVRRAQQWKVARALDAWRNANRNEGGSLLLAGLRRVLSDPGPRGVQRVQELSDSEPEPRFL